MKALPITMVAVILAAAAACVADEEIDAGLAGLVERLKSPDAATRSVAVAEILSLREGIAASLDEIVAVANRGDLGDAPKARALYLMGELGLQQCRETLERERVWTRPVSVVENMKMMSLAGQVAVQALGRAGFSDSVTLGTARPRADVSAYPTIVDALRRLRSSDERVLDKAEEDVLRVDEVISRGMYSILLKKNRALYADETKIAAAHVLGEYRSGLAGQVLLFNADLEDAARTVQSYPGTLLVEGDDGVHVAAAALVKLGGRNMFKYGIGYACATSGVSRATRDRIVRSLVAASPKAATYAYDYEIRKVTAAPEKYSYAAGYIKCLEEVRPIVEAAP